ncbi:MAG: phosphonate metabolism protein/1,5-bisphosphokinase (PRPP-forming) PhnN [Rhodoferax sp.]|jgi:ribose 1,5-bisphosphokinase|nr:phosphonate metabolism protein/1,5-bisphosphokinase (PRPP-forming) PhnN [Rhodoferax sp.]
MTRSGVIYMVGPSGVGKDSLLNWLRHYVQQLVPAPDFHFAQRTITRGHDHSNEAHEAVGFDEFAKLNARGAFALSWQAHGLQYGVRHSQLAKGSGWVLVNGSREYTEQARSRVPGLVVLHVSAPEAALRLRLAGRGREDSVQLEARMLRAQNADLAPAAGDLQIVNVGTLEETAKALCLLLQERTGLSLVPAL